MKISSESLEGLHGVAFGGKEHKSIKKFGLGPEIRVPTLTPFTRVQEQTRKNLKILICLQSMSCDPSLEREFKGESKFDNHSKIDITQTKFKTNTIDENLRKFA